MLDFLLKYINNDLFIWSITWYWILILFIWLWFWFLFIRKDLFFFLKKYISKKDLVLIFFLFVFSLIIRVYFLDNSLITMNDEFMYTQHARELMETWKILSPIRSVWWSFLLVFPFSIFWVSSYIWFYFSIFLWSLTVVILYLLLKIIFDNKIISFYPALLLSILPFHVFWSTKMETNLSSLLFIVITILFFIIYSQTKNIKIFYFTILLTLFSTTFRWENIPVLILYLFLLTIVNYKQIYLNKKNLFISLLTFFIWIITVLPNYVNQYNFSTSKDWTYWEWSNFWLNNIFSNIHYFLNWFLNNNLYFYYNYIVIFWVLLLFYNLYFWVFRKIKKEVFILITPFVLLFFLYNFIWLKYVAQESRLYMEIYPLYGMFFWFAVYSFITFFKNNFIKYLVTFILFLLTIWNLYNTYWYSNKSDYKYLQTIVSNTFNYDIYIKNKKCIYILYQNTYYTAFVDIPYTNIYEFLYNKKLQNDILNKFNCIIYIKDKFALDESSWEHFFWPDWNKSNFYFDEVESNNLFKFREIKIYKYNNIEYWFYKLSKNND